MPDIAFYLEFVLKLFFAFGIAFEIPIATILLVAMGMTTPENLATKRPYVIVGVFVAGMLLTPPDVVSQTLLAIPMWLLYEAGIFFSRLIQRRRGTSEATPGGEVALAAGAAAGGSDADGGPASPRQPGGGGGGEHVVGRDAAGGDPFDGERFAPMTEEEMEAELDAAEAEEYTDGEDIAPPQASQTDPVDAMLEEVMALREREDEAGARKLLYRVLADGDDDQRRVAMNILAQLDA
jgi:sec-independent protein translocase protein TatC